MDNRELISSILSDFKLYNKIENADMDNLYTLYIEKAIQSILNLTNRYEFPEELRYVVLDMIGEFYNSNQILENGIGDEGNYVKSFKWIN